MASLYSPRLTENFAEFETKLEIGRVALDTFSRLIEEQLGTLLPYLIKLCVVTRGVRRIRIRGDKLLKTRNGAVELSDANVRSLANEAKSVFCDSWAA